MPKRFQAHPVSGRPSRQSRAAVGAAAAVVIVGVLGFGLRADPVGSAGQLASSSGSAVAGAAISPEPSAPTARPATPAASVAPPSATPGERSDGPGTTARFPGGLLIADRGNGRLLLVTNTGSVAWSFPGPASLPRGQRFSADDAFVAPDGRTIVANDEAHQVIDRIDIATRRVIWQYGRYGHPGGGSGQLHTPDDAYPLANGDIVVADIRNCRILEIAPSKRIVRAWGRTGVCAHRPPFAFDEPNGDTPLPDGGLLVTEIAGSRVVRLSSSGRVIFDIHVPVRYPSDAQLASDGTIVVVDYSSPGAVLRVSPKGRVIWRYAPRAGRAALGHPSLAVPLPDGTIALNDDDRQRVVVIDPATNRIVWQYGVTDRPGRSAGHLFIPDGIDVVPSGTAFGVG
jgi:outer membrane protein assembly factor BamB